MSIEYEIRHTNTPDDSLRPTRKTGAIAKLESYKHIAVSYKL